MYYILKFINSYFIAPGFLYFVQKDFSHSRFFKEKKKTHPFIYYPSNFGFMIQNDYLIDLDLFGINTEVGIQLYFFPS